MPRIRSYSWNYTTSTTGTTITIPLPNYVQNDLLLAVITADTGTGNWSCNRSGWAELTKLTVSGGAQQVVWWKIAGSSELDPTFTSTVAETYNGAIISIEDVNTTYPFGNPANFNITTQTSAARYTMQQLTTTVANSLIIYAVSTSSVGVPSIIEGPVYGLLGADGTAESTGIGWGFMPNTGQTPNNIFVSNIAAGTAVKGVYQIAPPSSGAQIIPTYCAADNSIYLDPIHGTTAYNNNTAIAATADTNFGTSLGGQTAVDATIATAADAGINSFHNVAQLTTPSASTTMAGAELVFAAANRPDLSNKNFLIHTSPSTSGQLQRYSSIASGRGTWIGFRSNTATDYKIWQCYGVELSAKWLQPLVIHPSAGNTVASAGTLNAASVHAVGMWISGSGIGTTIWQFFQMWGLDTVTICGGNMNYPVDVLGIASAAADGHERRSVLIQGSRQVLIFQPIQFGNGGTNPIYLDLNMTAIEFPSLYNRLENEVIYNSIPNFVGLTYYAGPNDTIKHRNSIVSSKSPYHFRLHSSASTSATYDFTNLAIIGAGDIVLNKNITIESISIIGYQSLDVSNLKLKYSLITNVPDTNAAIVMNSNTLLEGCEIDLTNLSAGRYFCSVSTLGIFKDCEFIGKTSGGHAIRITSPGTYNFIGNKFYNFGANGTNSAAIFNDSGGTVTIQILNDGDIPTIRNGTNATTNIIANLVNIQVKVVDINNQPISNALVYIQAESGGSLPANTSVSIVRSNNLAIVTCNNHNLITNDKVFISGANQQEYNGIHTITVIDSDTFSYPVSGTPQSPATGNIKASYVILEATDSNGIITKTRSFLTDQPISGRVRKSTTTPFYKTGNIIGTIDKSSGFSSTIQLIYDF